MNVGQVVKRLGDHIARKKRATVVDYVTLVRSLADGVEPTDEAAVLTILEAAGKSFEELAESVSNEEMRRADLLTVKTKGLVSRRMAECHARSEALRKEQEAFAADIQRRRVPIAEQLGQLQAEMATIGLAESRLASTDLDPIQREAKTALCEETMALARREWKLQNLLNPSGGWAGAHARTPGRLLTNAKEELRHLTGNPRVKPEKVAAAEAAVARCQARVDALQAELDGLAAKRRALREREQKLILEEPGPAPGDAPKRASKARA